MFFKTLNLLLRVVSGKKIKNFLQNYYAEKAGKGLKNTMPSFVSIESSSVCNLSCPECAIGTHRTLRKSKSISMDLYKEVINEAKDYIFDVQLFFQGEPFLNKNIDEMVSFARKSRVATVISTNGTLLTHELSKRLIEAGLDRLIVSVDGTTQEVYETYRVGGRLQTVLDNVRELVRLRKEMKSKFPIIEFQMVVFRHNEHQISDFKRLAKSIGADLSVVKTAQIMNYENKSELIPTQEKYSRYVLRDGKWQLKKSLRNHCQRIYQGCVINSDGKVSVCCFDKVPDYPVGDLNDSTLSVIWNSDEFNDFRQKIAGNRSSIEICRNCTE